MYLLTGFDRIVRLSHYATLKIKKRMAQNAIGKLIHEA